MFRLWLVPALAFAGCWDFEALIAVQPVSVGFLGQNAPNCPFGTEQLYSDVTSNTACPPALSYEAITWCRYASKDQSRVACRMFVGFTTCKIGEPTYWIRGLEDTRECVSGSVVGSLTLGPEVTVCCE